MPRKKDLSFLEAGATKGNALDEVMQYVHALESADADIQKLTDELALKQEVRDKLAREMLPLYMDQHQIDGLKLSNGKTLSIKEDLYARLPEDPFKREEALSWLEDNGGGPKIKDELSVEAPDQALIDSLSEQGVSFSRKRTVNTNSLQAFFKECLGMKKGSIAIFEKDEVPAVFGLYLKREAKLS